MAQPLTSIEPLLPLLRERPFGVLSDIDGTLAPIVPRPEDAAVPEETRALLRGPVERGGRRALAWGSRAAWRPRPGWGSARRWPVGRRPSCRASPGPCPGCRWRT